MINKLYNNIKKERIVIIGSGWAGSTVAKNINCKTKYNLTVISNRNHMVFTPLLASSCVGTLHSLSVIENIRHIQPNLRDPDNHFYLGNVNSIDKTSKKIQCKTVSDKIFEVDYDKLVIATGGKSSTFGIEGVNKYAHFLKNLSDSQKIRNSILENICLSGIPGTTIKEKERLMNFVIVGGGPTGVEFCSELCNFINEDMHRYNPNAKNLAKITIIEGNELLGSFDSSLKDYASIRLINAGVNIKKCQVNKIEKDKIYLSDGTNINYGICVWSTGIEPGDLVKKFDCIKSKNGKIRVNEFLNIYNLDGSINEDIYSLGDCVEIENNPLPPLAQVAEQQGLFLSDSLNNLNTKNKFKYNHRGSMVTLTTGSAILESTVKIKGITSWLLWRSVYLTKLISIKNKLNVASQWFGSWIKGREISF
tara:strand:- start:1823 stop:3085 length:1263 start_codon:yes stop_codon:yes gene_type:complete